MSRARLIVESAKNEYGVFEEMILFLHILLLNLIALDNDFYFVLFSIINIKRMHK